MVSPKNLIFKFYFDIFKKFNNGEYFLIFFLNITSDHFVSISNKFIILKFYISKRLRVDFGLLCPQRMTAKGHHLTEEASIYPNARKRRLISASLMLSSMARMRS